MADIMGLKGLMEESEVAAERHEERQSKNTAAKSKTSIVTAPTSIDGEAADGGGAESKDSEAAKPPKDEKEIWDAEALPAKEDVEDEHDDRARPKYDILYKQDVGTEDVFLGLSDVDPSSTSCNFIVIKIMFPGNKIKDIDLDVTETKIVAQSPTFRLSTYLPHKVKHKDGQAKWDSKRETLVVTLPIIRDEW